MLQPNLNKEDCNNSIYHMTRPLVHNPLPSPMKKGDWIAV